MNRAAGRVLQSVSKGNNTYQYSYGIDGLRAKKNINGTKTYYYYDSNRNLVGMKKGDDTVLYYYDTDGSIVSMSVGEDTYFFIKNLQSDITKIVDSDRDVLATYIYIIYLEIYYFIKAYKTNGGKLTMKYFKNIY